MNNPQPGVLSDPKSNGSFITLTVADDANTTTRARAAVAGTNALVQAIGHKDLGARMECTVAIGSRCWDRLFPTQRPEGLRPFEAMADGNRTFPATAADILLHITSYRWDLNYQLARYLVDSFGGTASVVEDVQGFKYLDDRDLIDFVDGTENPQAQERDDAVLVGSGEPAFAGGSFVTVQRYVHDFGRWNGEAVEMQERVVGRTKHDDIELQGDAKPAWAHNEKSKLVDSAGEEIKMYRQNMAYGNAIEAGTVFIAYANSFEVVHASLKQMIYADDNGDYDRLLDYTTAVTGATFFAPSADFLAQI